jgi:hypothetical protein
VAFNPNLMPWMTILALLGAGIGYLIGGGAYPAAMVPALYGLCIGSMAGILVRIFVRYKTVKKKDPEEPTA